MKRTKFPKLILDGNKLAEFLKEHGITQSFIDYGIVKVESTGGKVRGGVKYILHIYTLSPPLILSTSTRGIRDGQSDILNNKLSIRDRAREYLPIAKVLAKTIQSKRNVKITPQQILSWSEEVCRLKENSGIDVIRIKKAVQWYTRHIGEPYVPVIHSGHALRQKFLRLEDAMERDGQSTQEPVDVDLIDPWLRSNRDRFEFDLEREPYDHTVQIMLDRWPTEEMIEEEFVDWYADQDWIFTPYKETMLDPKSKIFKIFLERSFYPRIGFDIETGEQK